jgi:hypothetical protein
LTPPNLNDAVDYYVGLLILQYRGLPKASQTIAILLKQAVADLMAASLATCFNLDVAVGPQLDVLGKYIGAPRDIGPPAARPYYGFGTYAGGTNPIGFRNYEENSNLTGVWSSYLFQGAANTDLTDEAYRLILQLKIILNASDGTLASIDNYLQEFFAGAIQVTDNMNMTLTYEVPDNLPVDVTTLTGYLPKPMGVGITVLTYSGLVRVLMDGTTIRVLSDGSTERVL